MSSNHHSPSVSVDDQAGVRLVTLRGEHDLSTADQIAAACAAPPQPTVIDLTETSFIDSSVIAELIAAFDANAEHGFAVAVDPNSHVARVLGLGLLGTIMPIIDDQAKAVRLASARQPALERATAD